MKIRGGQSAIGAETTCCRFMNCATQQIVQCSGYEIRQLRVVLAGCVQRIVGPKIANDHQLVLHASSRRRIKQGRTSSVANASTCLPRCTYESAWSRPSRSSCSANLAASSRRVLSLVVPAVYGPAVQSDGLITILLHRRLLQAEMPAKIEPHALRLEWSSRSGRRPPVTARCDRGRHRHLMARSRPLRCSSRRRWHDRGRSSTRWARCAR